MKIKINENSFLNKENYQKKRFDIIKSRKRKNNAFKFAKRIFMIFLIIVISLILYLISNKKKEEKLSTINEQGRVYSIDKNINEEYKDMQEYIYMVMNGTLYNPNEVFKESEKPKISIVITVYNGEGYLETTLLSIQNQDFKDVEIIMVDDCSKDNSVKLIKELMVKDPRVKLYQNEENKGMLYTKTRGVLFAKGKYVLLLDEDDIYAQKDAFSTLYYEAEKNNLDMLGFGLLTNKIHIKKWINIQNYMKTNIIYQPNLLNRMYNCDSINCKRVGGITSSYLVRTELFVDIIKQIDDKYLNVKMNFHDDFVLFFLLTRKARSLRQIKRIFYFIIQRQNEQNNAKIKFRLDEKQKNREDMRCLAYINYLDFILNKTNNDIIDKKVPSFELENWFLKHRCRYNKNIKEIAKKVLELFLMNDFIEKKIKNEILIYLNEIGQNTKLNSTSIIHPKYYR